MTVWSQLPLFDKLKYIFRALGISISFLSLIYEFFYFESSIFVSHTLYRAYNAFMIIRVCLILIICGYMFYSRYLRYQVEIPNEANMLPEVVDARRAKLRERGVAFYAGLPLIIWFGIYRMYPVKDFMNFLVFNYCIELFFQSLPLTLITLTNNAQSVFDQSTFLQEVTLAMLILNMLEILFSFILLMKENCDVVELRAHDPENHKPASEEVRRDQNYKLNRNWSIGFALIFVVSLLLGALTIGERICPMNFGRDGPVCKLCEDRECISC